MTSLLLVVPLIAAAPIPKELKPKDRPALDGAWKVTALQFNGQQIGGNQNSVWKFDGDTLAIENGGRTNPPRPIKTDPKASPAEFQFGSNTSQLGIYEVKDDTLTIALGQQPNVRPTDFAGQNVVVYKFARVKDDKPVK